MFKYALLNHDEIAIGVQTSPQAINNESLIDITGLEDDAVLGKRYENGAFVTVSVIEEPDAPVTYIHKSFFKQRLLPYAEDLRTAKAADAKVEAYFDLLNEYNGVDVEWQQTIAMISDAVARVKAVVPESTIDAAELLQPLQPHETFE